MQISSQLALYLEYPYVCTVYRKKRTTDLPYGTRSAWTRKVRTTEPARLTVRCIRTSDNHILGQARLFCYACPFLTETHPERLLSECVLFFIGFSLLLLLKGLALCLAAGGGAACTYMNPLSLAVLVLVVDTACYLTLNLGILAGTAVNAGAVL